VCSFKFDSLNIFARSTFPKLKPKSKFLTAIKLAYSDVKKAFRSEEKGLYLHVPVQMIVVTPDKQCTNIVAQDELTLRKQITMKFAAVFLRKVKPFRNIARRTFCRSFPRAWTSTWFFLLRQKLALHSAYLVPHAVGLRPLGPQHLAAKS
jgi:hypothetical protein